jgi:ABC-2 type transport system permease protein
MVLMIEKSIAFVKRDFLSEASYKFAYILQFFKMFLSLVVFFFISKLLGNFGGLQLKPYGGNYFAFVLIGIAFFSYLDISMRGLSGVIRRGQTQGTLEALLVTQTSIPNIILASIIYPFLKATLNVAIYLLLGGLIFGVKMGNANITSAAIILLLSITAFSGLGILSASFIMVFKQGDPIGWIIGAGSSLLGGLYYPISILPHWVQKISFLLPVTYSLEGMRLALLKGHGLHQLSSIILMLIGFSIILLPVSLIAFNYAVRKAKIDGSLNHY